MQITVRQARRELSEAKIKEWGECDIVSDGRLIATLSPMPQDSWLKEHPTLIAACDVRQTDKPLTELPLSKHRQAEGRLSDS